MSTDHQYPCEHEYMLNDLQADYTEDMLSLQRLFALSSRERLIPQIQELPLDAIRVDRDDKNSIESLHALLLGIQHAQLSLKRTFINMRNVLRKSCKHETVWEVRWTRARWILEWHVSVAERWRARICMLCGLTEEQGHEFDTFEILTAEPVRQIYKPEYTRYKSMGIPVVQEKASKDKL
ncbi:hypothetical protein HY620_00490 [Candidatus Uhrbacteria bacterium]|nr:hypothetical protein [Candidatus Uhrbacteria bacterium]